MPVNTLAVVNTSPYTLYVERNKEQWKMGDAPAKIGPRGSLTLRNCSTHGSEAIVLEFKAVRERQVGCLRTAKQIGVHDQVALLGTNAPGVRVVLRSDDF